MGEEKENFTSLLRRIATAIPILSPPVFLTKDKLYNDWLVGERRTVQ